MIGVAQTGSSFGGLADYLRAGRQKNADSRIAWVEARQLLTSEPSEAAKIMEATAAQNPRVEKPVYHLSISFPEEDQVNRRTMVEVADRLLRDLGLDEHQTLLVAHDDTRHRHLHLMINRVHPETLRAWHTGHDYRRIERSLRRSERVMGLRPVPGRHSPSLGLPRPIREPGDTAREARMRAHTRLEPWSAQTRQRLAHEFGAASSWADLERRLRSRGFRLRAKGRGLVVQQGRRQMKASRIRRAASAHRLAERFGMTYSDYRAARRSVVRDARVLQRAVAEEKARLRQETGWAHDERLARSVLSHLHAARARCTEHARWIRADFQAIYRDPRQALRRFVSHARGAGWPEASRLLGETPERLGRLRRSHRSTREAAHRAADAARLYGTLRSQRSSLVRQAAVAREGIARIRAARSGLRPRIPPMPRRQDLEARLLESSIRLGVDSLRFVLTPTPLRLARLVLRSAQTARSVLREQSR